MFSEISPPSPPCCSVVSPSSLTVHAFSSSFFRFAFNQDPSAVVLSGGGGALFLDGSGPLLPLLCGAILSHCLSFLSRSERCFCSSPSAPSHTSCSSPCIFLCTRLGFSQCVWQPRGGRLWPHLRQWYGVCSPVFRKEFPKLVVMHTLSPASRVQDPRTCRWRPPLRFSLARKAAVWCP